MTPLQRWAKEKKCCCSHPERHACAEEQSRRALPMDDYHHWHVAMGSLEVEPCECCCHDEFFEEDDDECA